MERDVWPLVDAATMQALDRYTIETLGVPGEVLMESAGRAVARAVLDERRDRPGHVPVLVVCGGGNNGGDGFVVARHLHALGVPVRLALVGDADRLKGDAAANWRRAEAARVAKAPEDWRPEPGAVVVDALFGTGLGRPVEGAPGEAIERLNRAREGLCIVSVDLPSGLHADSGQALGVCVEADRTVTIALPKLGLLLEPGRRLAGRVEVARVGIADEAPGVSAPATCLTPAGAGARLPARPPDGHKGTFGHALVVAGSTGKTGAAVLAATGAARAGAGLVTVACGRSVDAILEVHLTEAMTAPVADREDGAFALAAEEDLVALAHERDVLVLGPGLGRADETLELVRRLAARVERPLVIDADGLVAFAAEPALLARRSSPTIVTPHPGEAATLLGGTPAELNRDRPAAARRLAAGTGAVVLLKGAATVTAQAERTGGSGPERAAGGRMALNPTGGPALASGGTGDVLSGVVGGLLAQGLDAFEAARVGAFVHGHAADALAERVGPAGVLAGEVARMLPASLRALREAAARAPAPLGGSDVLAFPRPA